MDPPEFSLVVPIYNEEECFPELARRLLELMDRLDGPSEVVLVDDGSTDTSYALMVEANRRDPRFKVAQLSRNFGHQAAITAGLDFAAGRAVIVLDADLQDPPEVVVEMVARWREGYEIVYAVRRGRRGESLFKRATASIYYSALRRLTDIDAPLEAGDFRLVDRKALDAFRSMRERNRYVRGMFSWLGFRQTGVDYVRAERYAGKSKYPLRKMVKFGLDGIVGFSNAPLRIALNISFVLCGLSILGGVLAIVLKLAGVYTVPGWASLIVVMAFLGGIQLGILGMMGEYVGRIYDEVRNRPVYVIRESHGFPTGSMPDPDPEAAGLLDPVFAARGSSATGGPGVTPG